MRAILGLSLKSGEVAWVVLDAADGTVVDHDALDLPADSELAASAARSARVIARACGFEVDRVRLAWTDEAASAGRRLRTRLGVLGFGEIEVVPMACAAAVPVDPEATAITPRLALAYGAALAVARPDKAITAPAVQQISDRSRLPRRRIKSAVFGAAAAAALGLLCLSAGAAPQPPAPAATTEAFGPASTGMATVPAPTDVAATPVRKVVASPPSAEQYSAVPAQAHIPAPAAPAAAPEPTAAAELPHLSGARHAMGPMPGPAEVFAISPGPDMTELINVFTALP